MDHSAAGSGLQDVSPTLAKGHSQTDNLSFCATPADSTFALRRRTTAKDSIGSMIQQGIVQHQLGISLNLVFLLALTHAFFPRLRSSLEPFYRLQYPLPSGLYAQGKDDAWIVLALVIFFTGLRAFLIDYVLTPLAATLVVKKGKMRQRFAEQSYMILYYAFFLAVGATVFINETPGTTASTFGGYVNHLLNSLWLGFPRIGLQPAMKWYYLAQTAFWIQQVVVIHLEARRSDHYQMLTHHFVTIGLLVTSYFYRTTRVGSAILVLMDTVDLIFPIAKCLRYTGQQMACDIAFGVFVISWILTRHVAYCSILWSLVTQVGKSIWFYGTYSLATGEIIDFNAGTNILDNLFQPILNPDAKTVQWSPNVRGTFVTMLAGLQVITIVWFVMIVRVVIRVLSGQGADDSRSDDEEEADEEEAEDIEEQNYIEVTAEADDLYYPLPSRPSSSQRLSVARSKSKGISSGLNLGEHKEILNRIGCLSEEQLARERERRRESTSPQPSSSKRL